MNMKDIYQELQDRYSFLESKYGKEGIFGVFLFGSQNYKMDSEKSDIDCHCIIVPNMGDALIKQYESREIIYKDGSHIMVKDVREYVKMLMKMNMNFMEILYSNYHIVNPAYQEHWDALVMRREEISRYDMTALFNSYYGQSTNTMKRNDNQGKRVANALRIYYSLLAFYNGMSYEEAMILPEDIRGMLLGIKSIENYTDKVVKEKFFTNMNILQEQWKKKFKNQEKDEYIRNFLNSFAINTIICRYRIFDFYKSF